MHAIKISKFFWKDYNLETYCYNKNILRRMFNEGSLLHTTKFNEKQNIIYHFLPQSRKYDIKQDATEKYMYHIILS